MVSTEGTASNLECRRDEARCWNLAVRRYLISSLEGKMQIETGIVSFVHA